MFVVTGGGTGIGQALAQALAARGKAVLIIGRREAPLAKTADSHHLIDYLCADVSSTAGRAKVIERLQPVVSIQGLVHNAGIIDPIMPIQDIDEASWQRVMATNVDAPLFLTQALIDKLNNGRVLHISSGAAHFPVAGWAAYCVSKAALSMLTQAWQLESDKIAFAAVKPGIIDTNMQSLIRHARHMDSDKLEFFRRLKQQGQLLDPTTVALFLSWLLLDITPSVYGSQEWDIYDKTHHADWLIPPHQIPAWDE